jgi:deoxyribose-phosphate aldolase
VLCLSHAGAWRARSTFPAIALKVDIYQNLHLRSTVASLIDQTLLKPEASENDIAQLCDEARGHAFASVCVNPCWVRFAADRLSKCSTKVCATIGFPLGANRTQTKLSEAGLALADGALELDVVQNIGALRSGDTRLVREEIKSLAVLAHGGNALLKVILETGLLDETQKKLSCQLAVEAGADFVKTSTGFSVEGATAADIALMRREVGPATGVKASGGVRTLAALREMVAAGANRIGTSAGVRILAELAGELAPSDSRRNESIALQRAGNY